MTVFAVAIEHLGQSLSVLDFQLIFPLSHSAKLDYSVFVATVMNCSLINPKNRQRNLISVQRII